MCIEGNFYDAGKIRELSSIADVITTEIEHVNVTALTELTKEGRLVQPDPETLSIIQDKLLQKEHLVLRNVSVADFMAVHTVADSILAGTLYGYPMMLKNRKLAYDGRGNAKVGSEAEAVTQFEKLGGADLYAEKWVDYEKELAVMVVRSKEGIFTYPLVETVQEDSICRVVIVPANIPSSSQKEALEVARAAVAGFTGLGVYGVELFLLRDGSVILNEVAPRFEKLGFIYLFYSLFFPIFFISRA